MNHTYLFKEGLWTAKGIYIDEGGHDIPVEGESEISHVDEIWVNETCMRMFGDSPLEFQNRYEIVPFAPDKDFTSWTSSSPTLGFFLGRFIVVDDSILSFYQSKNGEYSGTEYLRKIDEALYWNRGAFMTNDKKLSSWVVKLRKVE